MVECQEKSRQESVSRGCVGHSLHPGEFGVYARGSGECFEEFFARYHVGVAIYEGQFVEQQSHAAANGGVAIVVKQVLVPCFESAARSKIDR